MPIKPTVHLIAAARPNFMKVAPLWHQLNKEGWCTPLLVHTGQHYDENMSAGILRELGLPDPDINLHIGSGTHAEQTAGVMLAYEKVCMETPPDYVIVVGDVNSTMACTIVAKKLHLSVAHLEAGLRSGDRRMPEEINRLLTDVICDLLWTPSPDADANLRREGIAEDKIVRVGNIMIDSYELRRTEIEANPILHTLALAPGGYGAVTLHRPSNVDDEARLSALVGTLLQIGRQLPLVFPLHPRTRERLKTFNLLDTLTDGGGITLTEPLSYVAFLRLVSQARLVITDSGGIQEETTYLDIPCMTLRENTERPITLSEGTNRLLEPEELLNSVEQVLAGDWPSGVRPEFWDGKTAQRVAASLKQALGKAR
jgi:UDP-N-acetylglucosamine 2-epimerase (non-hydrolysing)